jgi:hypothetical protein
MKATKDADGTIKYTFEAENDVKPLRAPMEKITPEPGLMDKLKEKAKELAAQENEAGGQ